MLFLYIGCLILLLYYLCFKNVNYWESKGIPFEKRFLFFGVFYNVVMRKEHVFNTVRAIYEKYKDPFVGIYIFNKPYLLVRSPEILKTILVKDFDKFMNRSFYVNESIDPISFHILFSAKDETWKNIRAKITPVFTSGKMKLMLPLMKECARDLTAYLAKHNGEVVEMRNVTKKFSVDVISSCAFGINSYCLQNEDSEIMKMATKLLDFKSLWRSIATLSYFFMPVLVKIFRFRFADRTASDYLRNVFMAALKEREEKKIVRHDLIDVLNNLKISETENEVYRFDHIKMVAQALLFFSAGNDTSSLTTSFALYELALDQAIQNRLRQEVTETFNKAGDFTYENIHGMKYLDMVLCEVLRKYPPSVFLNRVSADDYIFEETGLKLDKDIDILVPVVGLHYDSEYFPDPEKFIPERFTDKNSITPYTYMPFGEGPRNCIGQRFGLMVTKVALAYMIKDFVFQVTEDTEVPLKYNPGAILLENKKGIHLEVVKI